ncbi:hypothetical protein EPA93_36390 [Ktedonosporobacter rubrisoli]|uniref:Transport permease protein n=1 Tax=Ktedonosporobacter rubrisoli TaxID=2509675 RepID=A0A4V0YZW7_KTERU|nr:ABC transporter permease [Ktedonosporobacter rubrisoli]QBD81161.1 hypothetical protein EPA93_36390 [Ktedonosporobacter rubrisoli]
MSQSLDGMGRSLAGIVLTLGLVVPLGLLMASCSYSLALLLKDENGLSSVLNTITLPLLLLSGIILPIELAPPLLRGVALINPLSYAVEAARALFNGHLGDISVIRGFAIVAVLALLAICWAASNFRRSMA